MVKHVIWFSLAIALFGCSDRGPELHPSTAQMMPPPPVIEVHRIKRGDTLSGLLEQHFASSPNVLATLSQWKDQEIKLVAGDEYAFFPELSAIEFSETPTVRTRARLADGIWTFENRTIELKHETRIFQGRVESSLWESANTAGLPTVIIGSFIEIFAWEIDFARELRTGDQWVLAVDLSFDEAGELVDHQILSAEFIGARGKIAAVFFEDETSKVRGYFTPEGRSLRKVFLRSPIKYARITSRFNKRRFHPVLKVHRPHLGVDYGAPKGTPVFAIGDGTVTMARFHGGGGNTIRIRHNDIYQTAYMHLNGFARGVRSGATVRQGQVIGYVGSTGLSTGPHLHFEFYERGRYVDPLSRDFPSADPIPTQLMAKFREITAPRLTLVASSTSSTKLVQNDENSTSEN